MAEKYEWNFISCPQADHLNTVRVMIELKYYNKSFSHLSLFLYGNFHHKPLFRLPHKRESLRERDLWFPLKRIFLQNTCWDVKFSIILNVKNLQTYNSKFPAIKKNTKSLWIGLNHISPDCKSCTARFRKIKTLS